MKNEARTSSSAVEECQERIRRSLQTPMVKLLLENLEKCGCAVDDRFIKAVHCNKKVGGGYLTGKGRVIVCSNYIKSQDAVNQVVKHELIHAIDDCRANMNWTNCGHHACSEIRANHLSGDCHYKREFLRGFIFKIRGHEQDCVRRRAMKSVTANPHCSEAAAKNAMEAVWDVCYNDTQPFDRAP